MSAFGLQADTWTKYNTRHTMRTHRRLNKTEQLIQGQTEQRGSEEANQTKQEIKLDREET